MGHRIMLSMSMGDAKKIQTLGRKLHKDESLGINQAAFVLLGALASGEYRLSKVRKKVAEEATEE